MYRYFKEEGYYSDLYDLGTIEECVRIQEYWKKVTEGLQEEEQMGVSLGLEEEPKGIRCLVCRGSTKVMFKDLYDLDGGALRVLFFFECLGCGKRRGIFDNGQDYVSKGARFSKDEMAEWDKDTAERKDRERKDHELLERYRGEFCLSEVEGEEYIMDSGRMKAFMNSFKEAEQKRSDPDYQKAMELRKLKIAELEKILAGVLEQKKYIKLTLDKPVMDRQVVVPLTVQDDDPSRKEYDSVHKLQRLLKKTLEGTNWRLMSEGINYRLGYLSCRLKGYEQEADLMEIVRSTEI